MAGLGQDSNEKGTTYLSLANGAFWDKSKKEGDAQFKTETYKKSDDAEGVESGIRAGARYPNIEGTIKKVYFTENDYGSFINIVLDILGNNYTVPVKRNSMNSQDMWKFLLLADFSKEVKIVPFNFVSKDTQKRQVGINFFQDGEKILVRKFEAEGLPTVDKDFWKTASKTKRDMYFMQLDEWLFEEVDEKIIPQFTEDLPEIEDEKEEVAEPKKAVEKKEVAEEVKTTKAPTTLAMKKAIKAYISENYEGKTLPTLTKDEVVVWYNAVQNDEELPFENEVEDAETEVGLADLRKLAAK